MKLKYLLFGGIALAMAACADENITGGNDAPVDVPDSPLSTATYTIGGGDQSRVANLGRYGSATRADFQFGIPAYSVPSVSGIEELPQNNYRDLNGESYLIPAGRTHSEELAFNGSDKTIYIQGKLTGAINMRGKIIVLPDGEIDASINGGNFELTICEGATATIKSNIPDACKAVYNYGELELPYGGTLSNGNWLYGSKKSKTYINTNGGEWHANGNIDVAGTVEINGDIRFQNNYTKNICRLIAKNIIIANQVPLYTTCIEANSIELQNDDCDVIFYDNGTADFNLIKNPNKRSSFFAIWNGADSNVKALVTTKEITVGNEASITSTFHQGVYLNLKEGSSLNPDDIILWSDNAVNNPDLVIPVGNGCSEGYNIDGDQPEETGPKLDLVTSVESFTHDHDADKPGLEGDKPRRHLSATSLTFDGNGNIYASYHMRGGNWGGDTYDKDDIEGCIERWNFDGNSISIGNWLWTNEFDFNHIILDGSNIITVGHKGGEKTIQGSNGQSYTDFGGIIGRLPVSDFFNTQINADQYLEGDLEYKYLTTEVPKYDWFENEESGNATYQKVDYESAGDGNCVVRVGDYYYVATSAGYGKIYALDFKRVKDDDGNVQFVSTDGSTKYLVNENGTVHLLYLNDRPGREGSQETTSYSATLSSMATEAFPTAGTTNTTRNNVTPVDGKNVIAVDNGIVYACLSKGGLQIGNSAPIVFRDEENGVRSVNGVAVDSNYIYVANGSFLTVLDKNTHEKIAERKGNTKNVSANFVEVKEYNGTTYIFVAFGQDGIKVYTLNLAN